MLQLSSPANWNFGILGGTQRSQFLFMLTIVPVIGKTYQFLISENSDMMTLGESYFLY